MLVMLMCNAKSKYIIKLQNPPVEKTLTTSGNASYVLKLSTQVMFLSGGCKVRNTQSSIGNILSMPGGLGAQRTGPPIQPAGHIKARHSPARWMFRKLSALLIKPEQAGHFCQATCKHLRQNGCNSNK